MNTTNILDLENYKTVVSLKGINWKNQGPSSPMEDSFYMLTNSIKESAQFPILYERIDKDLIEEMNELGDEENEALRLEIAAPYSAA